MAEASYWSQNAQDWPNKQTEPWFRGELLPDRESADLVYPSVSAARPPGNNLQVRELSIADSRVSRELRLRTTEQMTQADLHQYLDQLLHDNPVDALYVPRRFIALPESGSVSSDLDFRSYGMLREREPKLEELLTHPAIAIVADPGEVTIFPDLDGLGRYLNTVLQSEADAV